MTAPARPDRSPAGRGTPQLRVMTEADLPGVLILEDDLFGEEAWSGEMLAGELAQQPASRHYLVADDDGVIAGYGGLLAAGTQADVLTLAVARDRWGQGIGAALLTALLAEAARRGARRCSSRCAPTTTGRRRCTGGSGSARSACAVATTSRPAPTPW